MNKTIGASLVALSLLLSAQGAFARNPLKLQGTTSNHHSAAGVALGNFHVDCSGGGSGNADIRTDNVNGHNQIVVHLNASNFTQSASSLESLDTTLVTIQTPINFQLVKGNTNWLVIGVFYTPHGSSTLQELDFATANAPIRKLLVDTPLTLIDNGNGSFTIPLAHNGVDGLPQGAQLNGLEFAVLGNNGNCANHVSDINGLTINNRPVGIDTTAAGASCTNECNGGGVAAD